MWDIGKRFRKACRKTEIKHLFEQTKQQTVDIIAEELLEQIPEHPKSTSGGAKIYYLYPK